jgi:hypothetical protein
VAFYAGSGVLLGLAMSKQLASILPDGIAAQVGHNSEAVLYAALVCATVQVLGAYRSSTAASWAAVAAYALTCVTLAALLKDSDLPSSVATLNEPLVAAGLTALYLNLPRPVRWPWAWSAAVLLFIVLLFDTSLVLDQAESLVPLMIAPIALDVVDGWLLDKRRPNRPGRRWAWCAFLVAVAACAMVLARVVRPDLSGPVDYAIDYAQRAAEAYWGWVLIHLYLGFWLPWRFRRTEPPAQRRTEIAA